MTSRQHDSLGREARSFRGKKRAFSRGFEVFIVLKASINGCSLVKRNDRASKLNYRPASHKSSQLDLAYVASYRAIKPTDKDDKTHNSVENKLKRPECQALKKTSKLHSKLSASEPRE